MFKIIWDEKAVNDLKKIDKSLAKKIILKVDNFLAKDPSKLGKPLTAEYKGLYRYRYGNYRIIYQLIEHKLIIIIVGIGHRSSIY